MPKNRCNSSRERSGSIASRESTRWEESSRSSPGSRFPEFLQKRLFDPLGMKDTTFYPTPEQMARLAKSYKAEDGKLEEATIFILDGHDPASHDRYPAANGGLFSTAQDYGRFCQMLLNQGSLGGRQYLKPESVKLMSTIQTGDLTTGFTEGNGWGLGCCVVRKPQGVTAVLSPGTFGHGGAYGTQAWIDPVKQRDLRADGPAVELPEFRCLGRAAGVSSGRCGKHDTKTLKSPKSGCVRPVRLP